MTDEIIATTTPANNGAGPGWCAGAPLIVRDGDAVWASLSMHDGDAPPYCNTHWELWQRPSTGKWAPIRIGPHASEREPCPVVRIGDGKFAVSIHPKLLAREQSDSGETPWFCQPALAVFDEPERDPDSNIWLPKFERAAQFTQHSYRGVAVGPEGSLLLCVMDRENENLATWRDSEGRWHPVAAPESPIRACYPNLVLHGRTAHFFAVGDIKEPNAEWRDEKRRVLNRAWDYVFRRLYHSWTPDVAARGFSKALEIDSAEETAGWMFNLDLLDDADGRVHLLWVRRNIEHDFLRDRFFPGVPIVESLMHAVIEHGRVTTRQTLLEQTIPGKGAKRPPLPGGRLHRLPDGRLVVVFVAAGSGDEAGLFVQELDLRGRDLHAPARVPVSHPPTRQFFTNTPRGGSEPSHDLDIFSPESRGGTISMRHIHLRIS